MLTGNQLRCGLEESILEESFVMRACQKDHICIAHSPIVMVCTIAIVSACVTARSKKRKYNGTVH
jgi:hypothetical protein